MNLPPTIRGESKFVRTNVPLFLRRFALSYYKEDFCIEYFVDKLASTETISYSLVFSYNPIAKDLHISRFYPELYLESRPKYLSATCFYLLIHHCADVYSLDDSCHISLETKPVISDRFYCRLKDFDFHVCKSGLGNVVELISDIIRLPVDTSMITKHIFHAGEIPFMK